MSELRVAIAGGGTGGHISPAMAVAEELQISRPSTEIMFMGSSRGIEKKTGLTDDIDTILLDTPRSGGGILGLPIRCAKMALVVGKAIKALRRFGPHALVGTGGYASVAPALAARALGIPLILLEQNAIPGRANRMLSRLADEVHTQFEESVELFPHRTCVKVTGNPVRRSVLTSAYRRRHRDIRAPFTLLVMGGSQGAHSINVSLVEALPRLAAAVGDMRILHCAGIGDEPFVRSCLFSSGLAGQVWSFNDRISELYAEADLAVCRAGATSIAESAVCGVPSILVPYPHARDNHQKANALSLVEAGAAELLEDSEMDGQTLAGSILSFVRDPVKLAQMGGAMRSLARPWAAADVVEAVERLAGVEPEQRPLQGDFTAPDQRVAA